MEKTKYFFAENRNVKVWLEPTTYFSYIEKVEEFGIQRKKHIEIHFDSIEIKGISPNPQTEEILSLPSQILIYRIDRVTFKTLFHKRFYSSLEGNWVKVTTRKPSESGMAAQIDGVITQNCGVEIDFITLIDQLTQEERVKFEKLRKILDLNYIASNITPYNIDLFRYLFGQFHHVNIYDVGQGNLIGLCNSDNLPLTYFDMGGGYNQNKHTYPNTIKICTTISPPIILSHWDMDHIETALRTTQSHTLKWFVPIQPVGLTHFLLAYRLHLNGNLFSIHETIDLGYLLILKCKGKLKNDSGLALLITRGNRILLPADAAYFEIPYDKNKSLDGIVATHHASTKRINYKGQNSIPTANNPKSMLAFSYGTDNTYNHNPLNVIRLYQDRGWSIKDYKETPEGSISMLHGPFKMTVPCHNQKCNLSTRQH